MTVLRVGRLTDVPDGGAVVVPAATSGHRDDIAVFRDGGAVFALDDTCSHALASLAEGWVEEGTVECPLHSARFCLRTGEALSLPATRAVAAHRIEVVDGEVLLTPGEPAG